MKPGFDCRATGSFLASGRTLANAGHCAALIGTAGVLFSRSLAARIVFAVPALAWPAACYFSFRVAIDASLFQELALEQDGAARALDSWLVSRGLLRAARDRTLADRMEGALALWRRLVAVVALQATALAAAILVRVFAN